MSKGTVLITGATGFLGFSILAELLRNDYSTRIVVRSDSKGANLASVPALVTLGKASSYTFHTVPDLGAPGALDAVARGVDYIIHTASPLPFQLVEPEKQYDDLVLPAIRCTLSALESAKRSGTVKRVVVTSSASALIDPELLLNHYDPPQQLVLTEVINEEMEPPFNGMLHAYAASKTAALCRSVQWMDENAPSFDLVNIAPTYVIGRHLLAQSTKDLFATSNGLFLRMVAGTTQWAEGQAPEVAAVAHIDDVAEVHVKALTQDVGGGKHESFLLSRPARWNDAIPITKEKFPEAVEKGLLPNNGNIPSKNVTFSSEKLQKVFGIQLRSVEEMVEGIVSQYLELLKKEKKQES